MGAIKLLKLDNQYHPWEQEVLNLLKFDDNLYNLIKNSDIFCLYVDINEFISFFIRNDTNRSQILKQLIDNSRDDVDYDNIIFLISFIGEGLHHKVMPPLINLLNNCGIKNENIRILYSTYYEVPNYVKTESFWEFFIKIPVNNFKGENQVINNEPTKHFLCLIRRIKFYRIVFLNELIKKEWWNNKEIIDLSFGVYGGNINDYREMIDEIDPKINDILPIVFDNESISDETQHNIITNNNQLINIVVETFINDVDISLGYEGLNNISGNGYITEKSMKPFFYGQLPIWIAQKNIVKIIRELGFDVFDDFFENHYYDEIEDDKERIIEVIKILNNLVYKNINLVETKNKYKDRILKNWEVLNILNNEHKLTFARKFRKLLFDF